MENLLSIKCAVKTAGQGKKKKDEWMRIIGNTTGNRSLGECVRCL